MRRSPSARERAKVAPDAQQRLLHRVLGLVQRTQHPVAVGVELATVGREQALEGRFVAAAGGA
jgi:hypothetical protein